MEQLQQIAEQLQRIADQNEQILARLQRQTSPWLSPDEACEALGLRPTPSARRKLQYARQHGFLSTFGQTRPYTYSRKEIEALRLKIESGQAILCN